MKRALILGMLIALAVATTAAAKSKPGATKQASPQIKRFLAKKGRLRITKYIEKGAVLGDYNANVTCDVVLVYMPGSQRPIIRGLKISVDEGGEYEKKNQAFLDVSEVESMAKALDYMISLARSWKGKEKTYTEVVFSTVDDFRVGFYQQNTFQKAFASAGTIGRASCFFSSMEDLSEFRKVIREALGTLEQY